MYPSIGYTTQRKPITLVGCIPIPFLSKKVVPTRFGLVESVFLPLAYAYN